MIYVKVQFIFWYKGISVIYVLRNIIVYYYMIPGKKVKKKKKLGFRLFLLRFKICISLVAERTLYDPARLTTGMTVLLITFSLLC